MIGPKSVEPSQLWAGGPGYLETSIAVTQDVYSARATPVELATWATDAGLIWAKETAGVEWLEGVGILVVEVSSTDPASLEGVGVTLSVEHQPARVFGKDGSPLPDSVLQKGSANNQVLFPGVAPGAVGIEVAPNPDMTCTGPKSVEMTDRTLVVAHWLCRGTE